MATTMADRIEMATQLAASTVKLGWYLGINRLVEQRAAKASGPSDSKATVRGPIPSRNELLADLRKLLLEDAQAKRDQVWQGGSATLLGFPDHLARLHQMFAELPDLVERRNSRSVDTVRDVSSDAEELPDYYLQDFHFQNGGHLSEESARLYDVQVNTLFYGSADAMRRTALRPIKPFTYGRDQRTIHLLDVACGTGRFLGDVRRTYPAMKLTGLDLSPAYLEEAGKHLTGLRQIELIAAQAEDMPLANQSQDIVTNIYLFHELPPEVRRRVAAEIARVLKPGGMFIMIDSLQSGDKPQWDGLLELFPVRFHEPFYRHYLKDDLVDAFAEQGLMHEETKLVFLSKMMVFRRKA